VCVTRCHWFHSLRYCHCGCQTACPDHPTRSPRSHSRTAGSFDCVDGEEMVVRGLDAHLPFIPYHLEFCPPHLRILEL